MCVTVKKNQNNFPALFSATGFIFINMRHTEEDVKTMLIPCFPDFFCLLFTFPKRA